MPSQVLFLSIMIMGTLTTLSSSSWFTAWMGMEINTLAFIPILASQKNKMTNEAMMKYFLTQTLASALLLIPVIITTTTLQMWTTLQNNIIFAALIMKMGAAPFHFWMPAVMEGLPWKTNMILTSLQKIAPVMMIPLIQSNLTSTTSLLSMITGALGGYNQTSLRKIMAYSSIAHMGGMLMMSMFSMSLTLQYLVIYIIVALAIMMMFSSTNISTTAQMMQISKMMSTLMMMNLLSTGGLPPFSGFYLKLMLVNSMLSTKPTAMMTMVLISTSMMTMFFYLRVTYTSFLLTSSNQPDTKNLTKMTMILTATSILALPLIMATS